MGRHQGGVTLKSASDSTFMAFGEFTGWTHVGKAPPLMLASPMEYARRFKVLVCAPPFDETDLEGARLRQILSEVESLGYAVIRAHDTDDAQLVVRTDSAIGSVLVDWGKKGLQG